MLGTRGIPAAYSGFETAVEHLSERFSALGHEVVVYCRPHMTERRERHAGARLVHLGTVRNKYLDTMAHTLASTVHMVRAERPDVALYFIAGNAPVVPLAGKEDQQRVSAELEHVAAPPLAASDQPAEDARHEPDELLSARTSVRLEPLRQGRESRDVDRDERAVKLSRGRPVPVGGQARHVRRKRAVAHDGVVRHVSPR